MAIHGIQHYRYKKLHDKLRVLPRKALTEEEINIIDAHFQLLEELYHSYQKSVENVSILVKQFEQHEVAIRKIVSRQKRVAKSTTR